MVHTSVANLDWQVDFGLVASSSHLPQVPLVQHLHFPQDVARLGKMISDFPDVATHPYLCLFSLFEVLGFFWIKVSLSWGGGVLLTPTPRSLMDSVLFYFTPAPMVGSTNATVDLGKSETDLTALTAAVGDSHVDEPVLVGKVLVGLDL